jgi:hypothetical protein
MLLVRFLDPLIAGDQDSFVERTIRITPSTVP